jgi:holin-like protein
LINALAILLVFQLTGEFLSQFLRLPIPGPVVGMALLFVALSLPSPLAERLRDTAQTILQHLSLLFVPAGVGVMLHAQRVLDEWLAISIALVASTLITVAVTALTIRVVARWVGVHNAGDEA